MVNIKSYMDLLFKIWTHKVVLLAAKRLYEYRYFIIISIVYYEWLPLKVSVQTEIHHFMESIWLMAPKWGCSACIFFITILNWFLTPTRAYENIAGHK